MEAYINALSCISHYNTISDEFFFEDSPAVPSSGFLFVTPPVYKDYIPANTIRRTSHILKMGISAGLMCLKKSGSEQTDAIIVGTAMGCYEDTDKFLRAIGDNDERMLTPTSFIQSTHNTVAGQLALLVKCHGYNFTYVHQNLSFENALIDAMLLLKEEEAQTILVGGVDELIPPLCELFERAGHIKKTEHLREPIWSSTHTGYVAGEGACFFSLAKSAGENCIAKVRGVKTIQHITSASDLLSHTNAFLKEAGLKKEDISLLLSGINGDSEKDPLLKEFNASVNLPIAYFKHLCGEYFTSGSFATWLAAQMIKKQQVPACTLPGTQAPGELRNILIVNQYNNEQYSLICISQC